ncbi:acetyl-coenzyme A transporter 1 [Phlyctema vagabunda]|uniref:Acetyl-coenzyme A transporter 1 n=1 Tax=Phlyctema vagabunda TaxID=108571 RepID=A0ABR4P245_9HELO
MSEISTTNSSHSFPTQTLNIYEPPKYHQNSPDNTRGYTQLYTNEDIQSRADHRDTIYKFLVLSSLYFSMGSIVGLLGGTLPTLLDSFLNYNQLGLLSLTFYPFSMKLIWVPILDTFSVTSIGRRKTWILPMLLISGMAMVVLGMKTDKLLYGTRNGNLQYFNIFVASWSFITLLNAVQASAVDGLAVSIMKPTQAHWASTASSVGLTAGQFMTYPVAILLIGESNGQDEGSFRHISVGTITTILGLFHIVLALLLNFLVTESTSTDKNSRSIWQSYQMIFRVLFMAPFRTIFVVALISVAAFQADDGATFLKLLDRGFGEKSIAILETISMPFGMLSGFLAGFLSKSCRPLLVWQYAFVMRLVAALFAQAILLLFPYSGIPHWYYLMVFLQHMISTAAITTMGVSFLAFYIGVIDMNIGGTLMAMFFT